MKNNRNFLQSCIRVNKLTAQTHKHLLKIPLVAHHKPLHTHNIICMMILMHTHRHKITSDAHHTPLHTHTTIHTRITMLNPVIHSKK